MMTQEYDAVVIGGGAAGMAVASTLDRQGIKVAIIEREEYLGGILLQCIHNGFGLHRFKEELTGPEYAERYTKAMEASKVDIYLNSTVMEWRDEGNQKRVLIYSKIHGVMQLQTRTIILSMGCRERNRGNIGIPGSRPAGVMTAGLAQRLTNIDGYIPGKKIVIVGSGDIGLIMARRMSWVGAKVLAVIEIMPYPSGITRNIVQCLNDFDIPLHLSHFISRIVGRDRVERVEITPLANGHPDTSKSFELECDTILLSVGLIPENELSRNAGIKLSHNTNGPIVNANLMTNKEGVFACGNVLHVHDLVDFVSEEADRCGQYVAQYLTSPDTQQPQFEVIANANVKYVVPNKYDPERDNKLYLRSLTVQHNSVCTIKCQKKIIKQIKLRHVKPAEMISLNMNKNDFSNINLADKPTLEVSLE